MNITAKPIDQNTQKKYSEFDSEIMPFKDAYGNVGGLVGRTLLSDAEQKEQKVSKYKKDRKSVV